LNINIVCDRVYSNQKAKAFNASGRLRAGAFFLIGRSRVAHIYNAVEQVNYLKNCKDVTFNNMDENAAIAFLENRSYFFKLKAFAKNYDKRLKDNYSKGRYIGLDFSYLVELFELDKILRSFVLDLTLDIERNLKIRINRGAMKADNIDPCKLAKDYLDNYAVNVVTQQASNLNLDDVNEVVQEIEANLRAIKSKSDANTVVSKFNELTIAVDKITQGRNPNHIRHSICSMGDSLYSKGIVDKYSDKDMPYWCLMELMSFGPLINFYKACFKKHGLIDSSEEVIVCKQINNLLRRVQTLRNAAAHDECLLNNLSSYMKSKSGTGVKKMLIAREQIEGSIVDSVSSVSVAMDLAALLLCYDIVVPEGDGRNKTAHGLEMFVERSKANREWFSKNYSIKSFFEYTDQLFTHFSCKFRF
jgi:abortive infection bacteriophage resistance protein